MKLSDPFLRSSIRRNEILSDCGSEYKCLCRRYCKFWIKLFFFFLPLLLNSMSLKFRWAAHFIKANFFFILMLDIDEYQWISAAPLSLMVIISGDKLLNMMQSHCNLDLYQDKHSDNVSTNCIKLFLLNFTTQHMDQSTVSQSDDTSTC